MAYTKQSWASGDIVTADKLNHMEDGIEAANAAISLGAATTEAALDAACQSLLDGTNTSSIWTSYYASAKALAGDSFDRYSILCRFAEAAAQAWSGKTYTLRSYNASTSSDTAMTPMDDLADATEAKLYTDSMAAEDDWTDEDPMTWYIRANALSLSDGTMNITAFEGEAGFDISGETAPVYTFSLALWLREWDDGTYDYKSWRTTPTGGYYPYAGDVAPDNTKRAITWHPTFPGGLNSAGGLTSGSGIKPYVYASATTGLTAAQKVTAYEGLWNDCDTKWLLDMWQLRHWNLENSNIAEGCTSYNYQYAVAAAESGVKRVLLTAAQAANLIVGSCVSVGDKSTNSSADRGNGYMYGLADRVRITSKETVTVDGTSYTAVNLDMTSTMDTTTTTYISTMPWYSGNTEKLPGHKDGCTVSLTGGETPLRVAGIEVLDGSYSIGLDPLYQVTANATSGYDYAVYECRDSVNLSSSVTSNYVDTGIKLTGVASGWNYVKAFVRKKLGVLFPRLLGGSSTSYYKSAFCGSYSAGVRCPWRFASLAGGGGAGLAGESGRDAPGYAHWSGRPRLCGAGKKGGSRSRLSASGGQPPSREAPCFPKGVQARDRPFTAPTPPVFAARGGSLT